MTEKATEKSRRRASPKNKGCCSVESVVSVDERGQMVLPKDIRDKAGIKPGDKLTLVTMEKDGKICCITLIKAEEFAGMVAGLIVPVMKDLSEEKK